MAGRNIVTLKKFFEQDSNRPVAMTEMKDFWSACSEQEKDAFCLAAEKQLGIVPAMEVPAAA